MAHFRKLESVCAGNVTSPLGVFGEEILSFHPHTGTTKMMATPTQSDAAGRTIGL